MRVPTPSGMSAREWADLLPADRLNAMFSAYVEDARLMQALHDLLDYCMSRGATASEFIRLARDWMERNDFVHKGQRIDINHPELTTEETQRYQRDVRNIDSSARLRLIYDTNVRQCYGQASWSRQAMPPLIQAFPAYRFTRFPGAKVKRLRHEVGEGDVRLKQDYEYWARYQNSRDIGGFEVPWAPFGYNSYMQQQPVSRAECEELGLLKPGDVVRPERGKAFGLNLEEDYKRGKGTASTRQMSQPVKETLLDRLKNGGITVTVDGERINVDFDKTKKYLKYLPTPRPPAKPRFTPAKTREEAIAFTRTMAKDVSFSPGITLDQLNEFNRIIFGLKQKYPVSTIEKLGSYFGRKNSVGARADHRVIELNHDHDTGGVHGLKDWTDHETRYRGMLQEVNEEIARRKANRQDYYSLLDRVEELEKLLKYKHHNVGDSPIGISMQDLITHEYGHTLMYNATLNKSISDGVNIYSDNPMFKLIKATLTTARRKRDIFNISQYANKDEFEFFAESFAAHERGEKLPQYIVDMIDKIIKHTH